MADDCLKLIRKFDLLTQPQRSSPRPCPVEGRVPDMGQEHRNWLVQHYDDRNVSEEAKQAHIHGLKCAIWKLESENPLARFTPPLVGPQPPTIKPSTRFHRTPTTMVEPQQADPEPQPSGESGASAAAPEKLVYIMIRTIAERLPEGARKTADVLRRIGGEWDAECKQNGVTPSGFYAKPKRDKVNRALGRRAK